MFCMVEVTVTYTDLEIADNDNNKDNFISLLQGFNEDIKIHLERLRGHRITV